MSWSRRLFGGDRAEADLDRELRDHLERHAADLMHEGVGEGEATRRARLAFGGLDQIKERCRDVRPLRLFVDLAQDLRTARRGLARAPIVTAGVIAALGIAIGANAAIFSVVNAVLLQPLPFDHPEQLAILWKTDLQGASETGLAPANSLELRERLGRVADVSAFTLGQLLLQQGTDAERVTSARVSGGFFPTLRVSPLLGRALAPSDDAYGAAQVAVISHSLWVRRFAADSGIIGRSIGSASRRYTVVGVLPQSFRFPDVVGGQFRPEVWVPLQFPPDEAVIRGAGYMFPVVRRHADASWEAVGGQLDRIALEYARLEPEHYTGRRLIAVPFHEQAVGAVRLTLLVLWAGVACVLAIACANAANVLLSRGLARSRELAVRASLGASRWRLVRQLLAEGLVLGVASAALGLILAIGLTRLASTQLGDVLPGGAAVLVDLRVLGFTALIAIVTGLAVGVLPALQLSRVAPFESLRHAAWGTTDGRWGSVLRSALLVAQIAIAVALVAAAALLARSFAAVERVDLGFTPEHVTAFEISTEATGRSRQAAAAFYDQVLDRLRAYPGVQEAGAVSLVPLAAGDFSWTFLLRDRPLPGGGPLPRADVRIVTPGALETLRVPLVAGRLFLPLDRTDGQPVAIVNERFARRAWPGESALGREIRLEGPVQKLPWMTVVGVVADLRFGAPDREAAPAIYRPETQQPWSDMTLLVRDAGVAGLPEAVRLEVGAVDATASVVGVRPMTDYLSSAVARRRLVSGLVTGFAAIALVLSMLGVYSAFAYVTSLRTREFGVRIALGASRADIVVGVLRRALAVTAIGLAIGGMASYASRHLLQAELYQVESTDPATLAAVCTAVLLTALVASAWPAIRASRTDPTTTLRLE